MENKDVERYTRTQTQDLIKNVIIPALRDNKTFTDILEKLQETTGKSKAQCCRYIAQAQALIKQDFNNDIEILRFEMVQSLRGDLDYAYVQLRSTDSVNWMKVILDIKARIASYSVNDLKPESDNNDHQSIQISFIEAK